MIREDTRKRYAEPRYEAKGMIGDRLHVLIYCWRERTIRAISLRKANNREQKYYEHNLSDPS